MLARGVRQLHFLHQGKYFGENDKCSSRIVFFLFPFIHLLQHIRSGDATARIWSIPEGPFKSGLHSGRSINALILKHAKGKSNEKSKDVTTLDWNVRTAAVSQFKNIYIWILLICLRISEFQGEGTLLATGSCDGQARIWTTNGMSTLSSCVTPL